MNYSDLFNLTFVIFSTLFGIVLGSFLNVVIYRIPVGKTIVKGHSVCMSCNHNLSALDLVPIFSWLFLGGKCRYCHAPIASRYCKIESFTGVCFLVTALTHQNLSLFFADTYPYLVLSSFVSYCMFLMMICCVVSVMMIFYDTRKGFWGFPFITTLGFIGYVICTFARNYKVDVLLKLSGVSLIGMLLFAVVTYILFFFSKKQYSKNDFFFDLSMGSALVFTAFYAKVYSVLWYVPALVAVYALTRFLTKDRKGEKYVGILFACLIVIQVIISYFINTI